MLDPGRMHTVQSPIIPVVGELIRQHPGTISLGQGVVHYGPPPQALAALESFFANPQNHKYQSVDGIPALLTAIEAKLRAENGIEPNADRRIVVTAGANMGFFNALLAITRPGDEIILPTPYYFNHEMAIEMLDCRRILVPTGADCRLDPTVVRQAITARTKAVVTISPNNPSGAVYSPAVLQEINAICREHGLYHISDEAYEYFTYDGARHFSPGSLPGSQTHTISLFSLSKAYGFASWRIGYMLIPERLAVDLKKAQDTILICPPVIAQHAAVGALQAGADFWRPRVEALASVRHLVLDQLDQVRTFCHVPRSDGAFYFLLNLETAMAPLILVERLIREFGVAAIPGTTFGIERGCSLRISYGALDRDTVAEGIGRLVRGLRSLVKG